MQIRPQMRRESDQPVNGPGKRDHGNAEDHHETGNNGQRLFLHPRQRLQQANHKADNTRC